MKKLLIITLILSLLLTSCGTVFLRNADGEETSSETEGILYSEKETEAKTEKQTEATSEVTTEKLSAEPDEDPDRENRIGFYDEVTGAGIYSRLHEEAGAWSAGVDIGCYDILFSGEELIFGDSYKALWQSLAEAEELTGAKIYLALEYTLTSGEVVTIDVSDYSGAEKAIAAGYVEIYLYDDVHQADGAWYSHLTADTTSSDTVISSVKVTAGEKIDEVESITLTARVENSLDGIIKLVREK